MKITFNDDALRITKPLNINTFNARERAAFYAKSAYITARPTYMGCHICAKNIALMFEIDKWQAPLCKECYDMVEIDAHVWEEYNYVYRVTKYDPARKNRPKLIIDIYGKQSILQFCGLHHKSNSAALYQCAISTIHSDLMRTILLFWLRLEVDMIQ